MSWFGARRPPGGDAVAPSRIRASWELHQPATRRASLPMRFKLARRSIGSQLYRGSLPARLMPNLAARWLAAAIGCARRLVNARR